MQDTQAFAPAYRRSTVSGSTVTAGTLLASVTVTGTNASATASAQISGASPDTNTQIQIANTTNAWAYVNFGVLRLTVTAATVAASYPVAPGAVVAVTVNPEVDAASVILGTAPGTATSVIFTRGNGV
jgi:hypothetical protein